MPTIDDIVNISGVSRSTVNRFLAGQQVRGDNAKRIKSAMKELNYRPDKLVEKRNCTIQIISSSGGKSVPRFQGYTELMFGMIKALEKEGATVMIQPVSSKYIPRSDGVIMYGLLSSKEDEIIEILKARNIPFVMAYREVDIPGVSYVTCDNYHAAYEMTEMLIKKGHKRIAVCGGDAEKRNMPEKLQGFMDCMAAHGLQVPSYLVHKKTESEKSRAWMQELFDTKANFTAFFGLTDAIAIRFMECAQENGYKVPDDFAVVGMDGTMEATYSSPKLTSVEIPFNNIGKRSAEALFKLIDNPDTVCIREYLKYEINFRESD